MKHPRIIQLTHEGDEALDEGKFAKAKKCYEEITKHKAFSAETTADQSLTYYNYAMAFWGLDKILSDPKEKFDNISEAIKALSECLVLEGANVEVHSKLAEAYILRAWYVAKERFEQAALDHAAAHALVAQLDNKVLLNALRELERFLVSTLGDQSLQQHNYQKAVSYYQDAIAILEKIMANHQPSAANRALLADHHYNLALCLLQLDDREGAKFHYLLAYAIYGVLKTEFPNNNDYQNSCNDTQQILLHFDSGSPNSKPGKELDGAVEPSKPQSRLSSQPLISAKEQRVDPVPRSLHSASFFPPASSVPAKKVFIPKSEQVLQAMDVSDLETYLAGIKQELELRYRERQSAGAERPKDLSY